jgi:homeobox-leucine zipper protein
VSSISGKRSEREENDAERPSSSLEDDGGDAADRKKLRLSKEQAAILEETFKEHNTLKPVSGSPSKFVENQGLLLEVNRVVC